MLDDSTSQLLVILILPVLVGFLALAVTEMWKPSRRHPQDLPEPRADPAFSQTPFLLSIADAYDPERKVLWTTQLSALQQIASRASLSELRTCWAGLQRYPELYEGHSFESWLEFLHQCRLIESDACRVRLTAEGREFLSHLSRGAHASR